MDIGSTSSCNYSEERECIKTQTTCTTTPRHVHKATPRCTNSSTPKSTRKTPTVGDRFIPAINEIDWDIAHFHLSQNTADPCPVESNYVSALEDAMFEGRTREKILKFKVNAPKPQKIQHTFDTIYTQPKLSSPKIHHRYIPQSADRILDAPNLVDDYYLNVLDWSCNNILAVALGSEVYLWNAGTSDITSLPSLDAELVTSLSWISGGEYLAIGTNKKTVQLWDVRRQKRVRDLHGHTGRVGVLAWADYILSSGSQDNTIFNHDVRIRDHHISTFYGHSQEVCGLKWNFENTLLASGGNDNLVNVWDTRNIRTRNSTPSPSAPTVLPSSLSSASPLFTLPHTGAVKAIAWCPFQHHLLATGGGSSDRCIRFWSSSTGACLNSVDTKSQVCQILWSTNYRELVSSHGFSQNQLTVWKYPSMRKAAELEGHTSRVLYLSLSPDGRTCVSGAGDETLRFWKIFDRDQELNRKGCPSSSSHSQLPSSFDDAFCSTSLLR